MTTDIMDPEPEKALQREEEIERLTGQLRAPSARARELAVERLGVLKAPGHLVLPVLSDRDAKVRAAAAGALATAEPGALAEEVLDALLAAIDDPAAIVCVAAIRSLGKLRADIAHDEIAGCLDDSDESVARAAVIALGRLGKREDIDLLLPFLDHPHAFIVAPALRALNSLDYEGAAEAALRHLRASLPYIETRRATYELAMSCIDVLGKQRVGEAVGTLTEIVRSHVGLRTAALRALGQIGAQLDQALLEDLIADPSDGLRGQALRLIMEPNGIVDLPAARRMLRHKNWEARKAALAIVQRERDRDALEQVRWMCYHESNPYLRPVAVGVLKDVLESESIPELLLLARDTNPLVGRAAISALSGIDALPAAAVDAIRELQGDERVGEAARLALVRLGASGAEAHLAVPATRDVEGESLLRLVPPEISLRRDEIFTLLQQWQAALLTESGARVVRLQGALATLMDLLRAEETEGQRPAD